MATLSVTENKMLMAQARESLRGKWGLAIGVMVVFTLIMVAIEFIPVAGWIITLIIGGPFTVGLAIFSLALSRNQDPKFSQLFAGFNKFGVALGAYLLQALFVFLWSLLLIIPGIIAALSYSQTYFIIAESDSIGSLEAISKSKKLMMGNRWKLFCLGLRFIGWALLCILTLGIGFLWLTPYMWISFAKFYDDLPKVETQAEVAKTTE
jgi:uncharacterized membrane protein